jgi:hypothetical protein
MKLCFAGSRFGMTIQQKLKVKEFILKNKNKIEEIRHGDIIGGDEEFHSILFHLDMINKVHIHPAYDRKSRALCKSPNIYKPQNTSTRKKIMLDNSNFLLATPNTYRYGNRFDVWSYIKIAQEKNIETMIVYPDGFIEFTGRREELNVSRTNENDK